MKYLKVALLILLLPLCSSGQSIDRWVLASQGGYTETGSVWLSSTVGEVVVETEETASLMLTQGFQQSELNNVSVEMPEMDLSIKAYPNPTTSEVILELGSQEGISLDLQIIDTRGQIVGQGNIDANVEHKQVLNFSRYAPGIYFIRLENDEGFFKSIKIEKIN